MNEPTQSKLFDAIASRDIGKTRELMLAAEFILIRVADDDDDDDENFGALTAEVDKFDALVSFISEQAAGQFISQMAEELFEEGEEINGFVVDGETLLDYLPENFGLLIDPENDATAVVEPDLMKQVMASE